jgi:hypothetical protein
MTMNKQVAVGFEMAMIAFAAWMIVVGQPDGEYQLMRYVGVSAIA